jgi:SAM-dependent methyltransferase
MPHSRETIKLWTGHLLEVIAPWVTRDLDKDLHSGRFIKLKRWILYARTARARARGDMTALQKSLFQFWRADTADDYFDRYLDRHQKWFLGPHHEIMDHLAVLSRTGNYKQLIEVGCGAGQVLEHCAATMPEVHDFVGVDINPVVIARDQARFSKNAKLQFVCAEAATWLHQTARPGTILLTYGGVMEYFSASTLTAMFQTMARHGPAAVAFVEPVDPDHDLVNDAASHPFGPENSFSHNHEKLLEAVGFQTVFRKSLNLGGQYWVMMVATFGR